MSIALKTPSLAPIKAMLLWIVTAPNTGALALIFHRSLPLFAFNP